MDLVLNLKGVYFDEIKAGTKTEEFRLYNEYWRKRIEGKTFERVIVARGYPKSTDLERRIVLPWRGYRIVPLTHPEFGATSVTVFAINVNTNDL